MTYRVNHLLQSNGSKRKLSLMSKKVYLFSTSSHPDATSIKSLDITFLKPEIDFSKYDNFILTSKQAVESLKQYKNVLLKPAVCISSQTAQAYRDIGGTVLTTGNGYGDTLEKTILSYHSAVKWLYLRAKVVASNFVLICQEKGCSIDDRVVYESKCSKAINEVKIEGDATLIFTSPSSVQCFLKNNTISTSSQVIVIGKTTAKSLPKDIGYLISKEKNIQSCFDLIN